MEQGDPPKELYLHRSINEEDVITMAKSSGYWSVWFTVFAGVDVILSRLISIFLALVPPLF